MAQLLYTTTDNIRGALGVTVKEVADQQVTDLLIGDQLLFSLKNVYPDHAALKVKVDAHTATPDEEEIFMVVKLYCMYEAAVLMTPQLQTLLAQKISDGDAEMQRFQKDNLEDTISRIIAMRNRYAGILTESLNVIPVAPLVHFGLVQPDYDPVTNSGTNPSVI